MERELIPPGELVDIGGRNLHLLVKGKGSPTVLLEAGTGGGILDWARIVPDVAEFTQVVAYDRAGLGWSDPAACDVSARRIVDDLNTALEAKGIVGPFVVVGHSAGGLYARLFCQSRLDDITGLLLIDACHEQQAERLPIEAIAREQQLIETLELARSLSRFGVTRIMIQSNGADSLFPELKLLPRWAQHAWLDLAPCQTQLESAIREFRAFNQHCEEVNVAATSSFDVPLTVLTAGKPHAEFGEVFSKHWQELQAELATLSSSAEHRVITASGHYIHIQQPEIVVEAIRSLVARNAGAGQTSE